MKEEEKTNPFANADGSPIDGKEPEFFEWEIASAKKELVKLPKEVQKEILESEKGLNDRMNS